MKHSFTYLFVMEITPNGHEESPLPEYNPHIPEPKEKPLPEIPEPDNPNHPPAPPIIYLSGRVSKPFYAVFPIHGEVRLQSMCAHHPRVQP